MPKLYSTICYTGALLMTVVIIVVTLLGASATVFPLSSMRADLTLGRQVFQSKCVSCHSVGPNQPPTYGPSLFEIGKTAGERRDGVSAEDYIVESIVKPNADRRPGAVGEMSEEIAHRLTRNELFSVAAYLCSLGGRPNYRSLVRHVTDWSPPEDANVRELQLNSLERGHTLFFQKLKCNVCHTVDNPPGGNLIAPDLSKAGLHTRKYLRESIETPDLHIVKGYEQWMAMDIDGFSYTGRRLPSPNGTLKLAWIDASSNLAVKQLAHVNLEELGNGQFAKRRKTSLMPRFVERISDRDIRALLDFLSTLR